MEFRKMVDGRRRASHTASQALGWFSIGLGLAELLAPRLLGRMVGMPTRPRVIQVYGGREIVTGIGILASADPTPWIWGRVAGDLLDLATLGAGATSSQSKLCTLAAVGAVVGVALSDMATARVLSELQAKDRMNYPDYSARSGFPRTRQPMQQPTGEQRALEDGSMAVRKSDLRVMDTVPTAPASAR